MAAEAGTIEEAATESSSSAGNTRIYIGGLGGGVKDSDVLKLFAPLGRVNCIDFVRTKDRAFGYMDFTPSSDKSLAKLFSAYNGCMWKGGRLRLEKAKEHYLERLKREWAEDAEPPEKPDIDDTPMDPFPSMRSKHETIDKAQLHIFFPKFRKVKALPFKGTGKHKYSFQRILVSSSSSSLPVHFCDCEEHSRSSEELFQQCLITVGDRKAIVNDKEINIINSVMNKLLEKDETRSTTLVDEINDLRRVDDLAGPNDSETQVPKDNVLTEQETDEEEDADNLVTNIGSKNIDEEVLKLMQLKPSESKSLGKRQVVISREKKQKVDTDLHPAPEKKIKRSHSEAPQDEALLKESKPLLEESNPPQTEEPEIKSTFEPAKGKSSWIQKSSWKELVGDAGGSTSSIFTISQVLPETGSTVPSAAVNPSRSAVTPQPVKSVEAKKSKTKGAPADSGESNVDDGKSKLEKASPAAAPFGSGQVHSFVRSRDSEKEWAKAKTALTGHLKRSRNAIKEAP